MRQWSIESGQQKLVLLVTTDSITDCFRIFARGREGRRENLQLHLPLHPIAAWMRSATTANGWWRNESSLTGICTHCKSMRLHLAAGLPATRWQLNWLNRLLIVALIACLQSFAEIKGVVHWQRNCVCGCVWRPTACLNGKWANKWSNRLQGNGLMTNGNT